MVTLGALIYPKEFIKESGFSIVDKLKANPIINLYKKFSIKTVIEIADSCRAFLTLYAIFKNYEMMKFLETASSD